MFRQVALLITIIFTLWLLWVDLKKSDRSSKAFWIPLIWMFFAGTREFTAWFHLGGAGHSPDSYTKGSLIDALFQFLLILSGVAILFRRRLNWGQFLTKNSWIWLYFLFGGISILWSDYTFVAFKRWVKSSGPLVMALVILTEKRPYEAFGDVLRRLAILVIPLSITLCKFFPGIGRSVHRDSWMYNGMAAGKNLLGQLCLLSGIYFLSSILLYGHRKKRFGSHLNRFLDYLFLGMIVYLLHLANSATSLICLIITLCLFLVSRISLVAHKPKQFLAAGIVLVILIGLLDETFHLWELVLSAVGRNPDLTSRHPMWDVLIKMNLSPIFGVGYESFWLGDRMDYLWYKYEGIIQSHNGYLETYLNLGIIGLSLMVANILSGFLKVIKYLTVNYPVAILRLSIIVVVAIYNWTEASFYGINNMFLLFFVAAISIPTQQQCSS